MTTTDERTRILEALQAWINQRPGLEPGNYISHGRDVEGRRAYFAEVRGITKDLHHARELLAAVWRRQDIDADALKVAFRAFSGRLSWDGQKLSYCTGQYWPTEYRRAACAMLRSALWDYWRADILTLPEDPKMNVRERILRNARLSVSPGVYRRWFKEA